jgi:serine/threonine protein kinase
MTTDLLVRSQDQLVAYRLGGLVHRSEAGSVYETEFRQGERLLPAVVRICQGGTPQADRLLAQWRSAIELRHPNLLSLYAAGDSVLDGVPVVYVVMERADESLDGVLPERALSEAETRELLLPAVAALSYLHKSGYSHSALKASNILAVEEQVKLSSDSIERSGGEASPAEDMWALGMIVVQSFTQELPRMGDGQRPDVLRRVSGPFVEIVRHCLDPNPATRWTADQVAARLDGREEPVISPRVAPAVAQAKTSYRRPADVEDYSRVRQNRVWLYGALGVIVLLALVIMFGRNKDTGPAPVTSLRPATQQVPSAPSPVLQGAIPAPEADRAPPAAAKAKPSPYGGPGRRTTGWSVVVASYSSRGPAEKRQRELARRWPDYKVGIFEQHADRIYYLVTIGERSSEDEAQALRKRAVASGFPRDTYIKRFR